MTGTRGIYWLILLGFLTAGVFGGVVVASGNLVLIGLAVGAIVGIIMLSAIEAVIWVILVGTLLISGPLFLFFPGLSKLAWLFSMLGFFLTVAAILYAGTRRFDDRGPVPAFVPLLAVFIVASLGMSVFSGGDFGEILSAVKRQYQYWGLLFALAVCPIRTVSIRNWTVFLFLLSLMQFPMALYQRVVLVPMRHNMMVAGGAWATPVDIVAGTFEAALDGAGNSAGMSYFLIVVLAGLLCCYRENMIGAGKLMLFSAMVAAPLALGETKVVVVMMPLALAVVYSDVLRKRPLTFLAGAVVILMGALALGYVYMSGSENDANNLGLQGRIQDMWDYNFGDRGYYGGRGLNRTTVITYWWQKHGLSDPVGLIFGHGLGSSFDGSLEYLGHIARQHPRMNIGLTSISVLLWDFGLLGLVVYLTILAMAFRSAGILARSAAHGMDRTLMKTAQASIVTQCVLLNHADGAMSGVTVQVMLGLTLGLIAWRWRHRTVERVDNSGPQPAAGARHV